MGKRCNIGNKYCIRGEKVVCVFWKFKYINVLMN